MMAQGSLAEEDDSLYQISTIGALMQGVYDGTITFGELGERGDFGLGTVQALDGEMVAVDGRFYQVKSDGVAYSLSDSMITPFSVVTFFDAEETINLGGRYNLSELQGYLDNSLEVIICFTPSGSTAHSTMSRQEACPPRRSPIRLSKKL